MNKLEQAINTIFNFIKKRIWLLFRRRDINKAINDSMVKNERILERLGDHMDYDGMGNYGRFPPQK